MITKINKHTLFIEEVYSFTLPNFNFYKDKIKQIIRVEENIQSTAPDKQCNVVAQRTSWNSHQRYPIMYDLSQEISQIINQFIQLEGYDIPNLEIQDCWINWYKKDEYANPHDHGSVLSSVLFVDVKDTDANFVFNSDKRAVFQKKDDTSTNFNNLKILTPKDGTVIFFDGSVMHSVSANQSNKERVTAAFNYRPEYLANRY
jgi:uncharacterized protein (TIGR02466 family)|tara:strand:+ start:65 stop:670 length:606 start_codon:yes stop_codon:yes gene_type:complete